SNRESKRLRAWSAPWISGRFFWHGFGRCLKISLLVKKKRISSTWFTTGGLDRLFILKIAKIQTVVSLYRLFQRE
ncbi:hypothetical protein ACSRCJ_30675, partial [Salmonella enterica]